MQVSLPSGEKAELRTTLKAKDKFAIQGVIRGGGDAPTGGVLPLMETALLARLIDSWSFDVPLPSQHACEVCTGNSALWHDHVRDEFGEALDIDDYNALEDVITPLLQKVLKAPNLETPSGSAASS